MKATDADNSKAAAGTREVSDLRVRVYGRAEVRTIRPKRGKNAGTDVQLLRFRAFKSNSERNEDGTYTRNASDWYSVEIFGPRAEALEPMIADGMVLFISGTVRDDTYTDKEGNERTSMTFNVRQIGLDLLQRGLVSISYNRPSSNRQESD